ncbi:hypothetical protein K439DRAFT_554408 [Ramaria rubella]|nr:hypothetical protein K439DRAFT_554408 [Ramaria rubella]
MSLDESTVEDDEHVYVILKKPWRSATVMLWLRNIDLVHLNLHMTDSGSVTRGNWLHICRNSVRNSNRLPVKGLSKTFYNADWLSTPEKSEDLNAHSELYDLSHSDTITQIVSRWKGRSGACATPKRS